MNGRPHFAGVNFHQQSPFFNRFIISTLTLKFQGIIPECVVVN